MVEDEDGYNYLHNDILLMGTSLAFDLYCTGWKSYYMSGESKKYKHGGHNFHAYNISENNLDYSKSLEKLGNGAQVLFEKQREESGHDCGGKGRVGPVVHGPGIGGSALVGLHRGVFCLPAVRVSESRSVY